MGVRHEASVKSKQAPVERHYLTSFWRQFVGMATFVLVAGGSVKI